MKSLALVVMVVMFTACATKRPVKAIPDWSPFTHQMACRAAEFCGEKAGAYIVGATMCYVDDMEHPTQQKCYGPAK